MPRGWQPDKPMDPDDPMNPMNPEPPAGGTSAGKAPGSATFVVEWPRRSLDELVVPESVLRRVNALVTRLEYHAQLFDDWNLKSIDPYRRGAAINLYGPSGTGKSLCAEGLAHRIERPFIRVDYAAIESRYVGETPKNIVRCFAAAHEHNAVLIFDEADSILGSRLSNVTQSADHSVNVSRAVMLSQLDRFEGLVVFTTNFPKNYDAAFVRRILGHVRFDAPDIETRRRLWKALLPEKLPRSPDVDEEVLAAESEGLVGGDLVNIIVSAATAAVSRPPETRHVTSADLLAEIAATRAARRDVGKRAPEAPTISWEKVADADPEPDADPVAR